MHFRDLCRNEFGVDIGIASSTKYISGGVTSLGGLILDYGTLTGVTQRNFVLWQISLVLLPLLLSYVRKSTVIQVLA